MEKWLDVVGYEGVYSISSTGVLKSLANGASKKEKILKTFVKHGYPAVKLCKEGVKKHYTIHRLVALHFIPNPQGYPYVNHKDENRANHSVENLEWCTPAYNTAYSSYKKIKKTPEEKSKETLLLRFKNFCHKYNLSKEDVIRLSDAL